jgi:5-formyltetrahydrofolate cyclo-ligase
MDFQKSVLRKSFNHRRSHAFHAIKHSQSALTCLFLSHFSAILDQNLTLASYWPIHHELSTLELMHQINGRVHLCLPIVPKDGSKQLLFAPWEWGDPLEKGMFGVCEPKTKDFVQPDVILVPLLAFDGLGSRLGYGGGYYDHSLAYHKHAYKLGIGFEAQYFEGVLPQDAFDIKMDACLTESRLYIFNDKNL